MKLFVLLVLLLGTQFEVVSVKLADPAKRGPAIVRGGPGSSDPGFATMENIDLFSLTAMAYGVHRHQLLAPDWLSSTRVNISARVPKGATVDQYREMLQALLAERFRLMLHHEPKEVRIYHLVVAKNGPKIKEVEADPNAPPADGLLPPLPRAAPPPGARGAVNLNFPRISMERFTALLSGVLGETIVDDTGLRGVYAITLRTAVGSDPAESVVDSIFDAVEQQLGLKLIPRKEQVDALIIDGMDKTPSGD